MHDMKRRFALYGFGFFIGIILVFFFLGGKRASCNWLPNDRILNIIQQKKIEFSEEAQLMITKHQIDSLSVHQVLRKGNVDFSKSEVKNNPCRKYIINGNQPLEAIELTVQLCDSIATIIKIKNAP